MKNLILPLFVLIFAGAVLSGCDSGKKDKDKDKAPQESSEQAPA